MVRNATSTSKMSEIMPDPVSILGTRVVPFQSYSHVVQYVQEVIEAGGKSFCVAINPEKVQRARTDPALRNILNQADIGICDGVGVAIAAKLLHGLTIKRCTGCDLFMEIIDSAAEKGWSTYLLGASSESNQAAAEQLAMTYPNLQIAGRHDGYFKNDSEMIDKINASRADILFVAMGSPKQEYWIWENRSAINAPFCMGVGGSFDVLSGHASRAPKLFRKTGTEFLFRLITNPSRWRRQLVLPMFAWSVLKTKFLHDNKQSPSRRHRPENDAQSKVNKPRKKHEST